MKLNFIFREVSHHGYESAGVEDGMLIRFSTLGREMSDVALDGFAHSCGRIGAILPASCSITEADAQFPPFRHTFFPRDRFDVGALPHRVRRVGGGAGGAACPGTAGTTC